ncbi:MAG: hypothetical protein AABX51_04090 [Nanoarchaeota archaeon]
MSEMYEPFVKSLVQLVDGQNPSFFYGRVGSLAGESFSIPDADPMMVDEAIERVDAFYRSVGYTSTPFHNSTLPFYHSILTSVEGNQPEKVALQVIKNNYREPEDARASVDLTVHLVTIDDMLNDIHRAMPAPESKFLARFIDRIGIKN